MARLLIVDDDQYILDVLNMLLTSEGYEVSPTSDCRAAVDMIKQTKFDLVVTDLRMSPINGIELLRIIREDDKSLPVIMLTAYGSPETAREASQLGAFDYLTKPFDADEVLNTISRALESGGKPAVK